MPSSHGPAGRTPSRVAERPTWLVSRAFTRSSGLLARAFEEHGGGLRGHHFRLLAALHEWGPASQADLGRDTRIDRSDVTAALVELEARGLVTRQADPAHLRRKIVSITIEGLEQLEVLDAVVEEAQTEFMAPLTPRQREQFRALMSRLLDG